MERLQKFLARTGIASRRHSEEIIAQGRVRVNGHTVTVQGLKIDPLKDRIEVDGRIVLKPEKKIYILLNKPSGYVTTVKDPRGRRKVTDLLKNIRQRVYPVGRLDYDTEGLLLLTNDGDLAYAMTHPSHEIPKTYLARVRGVPADSTLKALARGVMLDDGPTAPARVRRLAAKGDDELIEITIHEGRNRQVRRMCEHIGHPVISLRRISIGPLRIEGLKPGEYRILGFKEVSRLKKLVKVNDYQD